MRTTKRDDSRLADAFGKALTSARARGELTQSQAAVAAKIGGTTLWRLENGERLPDVEQLSRLADVYRVTITWIVESAEQILADSITAAEDEGEVPPPVE
jgi:transcriptional regulator with XRE-family HTH domain